MFFKNFIFFAISISQITFCAFAIPTDPTSKQALLEEENFFKEIESRNNKKNCEPNISKNKNIYVNQVKQKEIIDCNITKQEKILDKKETFKPIQKTHLKVQKEIEKKFEQKQDKPCFSGFYAGLGGRLNNVYTESDLWSLSHRAVLPVKKATIKASEVMTIYYGSYAYDRKKITADGFAFLGYDLPLTNKLRFGVEIQGGVGCRGTEITSNGVFAERGTEPLADGYSKTFDDNGNIVEEKNFGYTRQTIETPYHISLLPRVGFTLSNNAFLYTMLGMKYGLWEVTDHPETIEVVTTYDVKTNKDVIYSTNSMSVVGGIGIEALITKQAFLRLECLYSNGPNFSKDKESLQSSDEINTNRQLEYIDTKSVRNLSIGFGAGWRF